MMSSTIDIRNVRGNAGAADACRVRLTLESHGRRYHVDGATSRGQWMLYVWDETEGGLLTDGAEHYASQEQALGVALKYVFIERERIAESED